jgi:hypothetical protein
MRAIFISYRRQDAEGQAGRLFDDLKTQFGEDAVFMDVAGIEAGRDFRRAIDEHVASCGVLLAVIGKSWLDARDEEDRRRLDDPMDFVRLETASALQRDIPVIPVLVQGARMPRAEQLPQDLADFAYRNAVELTHARWDSDVEVLVKALRPHVNPSSADGHRVPVDRSDSGSQPVQALPSPGSSDEAGTATRAAAQPRKRSLSIALGALATAIALTSGGFVLYQKSTQGAQLARKAEILEEARRAAASELVAARKQAEEKAAEGLEARKRAKERAEAEENAAARKRAQETVAAEELDARRRAQAKVAAEELDARTRAQEKAAAEELESRRRAQERAVVEERESRRRAPEQATASHRARWPSYNFPPPNGGLLVFSIMPDGNPACASYNGSSCLWGVSYEQIDFPRLKPLVCGEAHRALWRTTGYENPSHWCSLAKRVAQSGPTGTGGVSGSSSGSRLAESPGRVLRRQ